MGFQQSELSAGLHHLITGMISRFWGNLIHHLEQINMVDSVNKKHAAPCTQRITVVIADW